LPSRGRHFPVRRDPDYNDQEWTEWAEKQVESNPEAQMTAEEWIKRGKKEAGESFQRFRDWRNQGNTQYSDEEVAKWVEDFITENKLEGPAVESLREATQEEKEDVINRGSLQDVKNPAVMCLARLKDVRAGLGKGRKGKGKGKSKGKDSGEKGEGKGKGKLEEPPPEKLCGEFWEEPRQHTGMTLLSMIAPPEVRHQWTSLLNDDSRRSYAGFMPSPLDEAEKTHFFDTIRDDTDWQQPEGRLGPIPRKTAWMVAKGCECFYSYGGIQVEPKEYPPWMTSLMSKVMPLCGLKEEKDWPTSCNINLYEDGGMSVGWHSDDEALFQGKFRDIYIVSLSLGVTRKFELRLNWPDPGEKPVRRVFLSSGDIMTMEGMVQKHFMHRVPREENIEGPRINLTWRWILKHRPRCPVGRVRQEDSFIRKLAGVPNVMAPPQPRTNEPREGEAQEGTAGNETKEGPATRPSKFSDKPPTNGCEAGAVGSCSSGSQGLPDPIQSKAFPSRPPQAAEAGILPPGPVGVKAPVQLPPFNGSFLGGKGCGGCSGSTALPVFRPCFGGCNAADIAAMMRPLLMQAGLRGTLAGGRGAPLPLFRPQQHQQQVQQQLRPPQQ